MQFQMLETFSTISDSFVPILVRQNKIQAKTPGSLDINFGILVLQWPDQGCQGVDQDAMCLFGLQTLNS